MKVKLFIIILFFISNNAFSQQAFNLRSITAGININKENYSKVLNETAVFLKKGRDILEKEGFTLEGVRISTNPFPFYTDGFTIEQTLDLIKKINDFTSEHKIALSIGPGIINNTYNREIVEKICTILTNTSASSSIVIASKKYGVHYNAIKSAAEVIKKLSEVNTMANFSFAATANIPSETPFFPGAYHNRSYNSFSIGTESAKLVMKVFSEVSSISNAKKILFKKFEKEYKLIEKAGLEIQNITGWIYEGVDTSPAPMKNISIGKAIENLIKAPFGSPGTITACSIITDVIHNIDVKKAGYSGLMLPVMEDEILAERAKEGRYGIDELLSYSAVCGTGLDVIPLPGDISVEKLEKILLDVASISLKLDKPLSARLIPVKGKKAGEDAILESEFLVPTKVFNVK
ncbi:hypothetical protein DRQ09_08510 [candidate division KSB1 bacterium]|nr:MAG: hypothetical protein DRQ09_08510 [candidate division KSB1 bacterium]